MVGQGIWYDREGDLVWLGRGFGMVGKRIWYGREGDLVW